MTRPNGNCISVNACLSVQIHKPPSPPNWLYVIDCARLLVGWGLGLLRIWHARTAASEPGGYG